MKSLTMRLTMAAAAMTVMVGVASAQPAKADIPFAFRSGEAVMTAGTYLITASSGGRMFHLQNLTDRNGVMVLPEVATNIPAQWATDGKPRLVFQCASGRCTLVEIWTGGDRAYQFRRPKLRRDEEARLVIVPLTIGSED